MKRKIAVLMCSILVLNISNMTFASSIAGTVNSNGDSTDETISNEDTSTEDNKFGDWIVSEGKDKFGRPNGDTIIYQEIEGTFSNSAVTDGELKVLVIPGNDEYNFDYGITLGLYEYGKYPVTATHDTEYDVYVLVEDENKEYELGGFMLSGSQNFIVIDNKYYKTPMKHRATEFAKMFAKEGVMYFYIQSKEYQSETYSFRIDTTGLYEVLEAYGYR